MEAVKQGSATVGLKNKTHAVVVALKRASSELAAHQKKILHIDSHIAVSISGEGECSGGINFVPFCVVCF